MAWIDLLLAGLLVAVFAAMVRDAARAGWTPRYLLGSALVLGGLVGTFFVEDALGLPDWSEFVFAGALLAGFVLQWSGRAEEP